MRMREIPKVEWQREVRSDAKTIVIKVFKGRGFLVQVRKHNDTIRLSINKVKHHFEDGRPIWEDGITWDELQAIKNECGYADKWMCEYYPPEEDVINVANIRHLWLMDKPPENNLAN